MFLRITIFLFFSLSSFFLSGSGLPKNGADLLIDLEKMRVLGTVLYIAAHPDDENTGLMAYLSKEKKYRTIYLSITRGDGGQNLIGAEKGNEIGIVRSQELLEARRIDGGEQFFTRAIDFGYSKSVAETMQVWGREELLSDVVWLIRRLRPDVIITRFPADESRGGHGHHPAATILALEAFTAAADPGRFPEQLKKASTWQARRIFWNKWRPKAEEQAGLVSVDLGRYNPLLGESYNEIAARSRSMHKSQGFGMLPSRGSQMDYFQLLADASGSGANSVPKDLFEGIDTGWSRVKGGDWIGRRIEGLRLFDVHKPWQSLPLLLEIDELLAGMEGEHWAAFKRTELLKLIQNCSALFIEALTADFAAAPGDDLSLSTTILLRAPVPVHVKALRFPTLGISSELDQALVYNIPLKVDSQLTIPPDYPISQPYWLIAPPGRGLFGGTDSLLMGLAQNPPALPVELDVMIYGRPLNLRTAARYRWQDRVDGEKQRPFELRPPVTANFQKKNLIFHADHEKEIVLTLKNHAQAAKGRISLQVPGGWQLRPEFITFDFGKRHDERRVVFWVRPPQRMDSADLEAVVIVNDRESRQALLEIQYPHIDTQVYFPPSRIRLIRLDARIPPGRIGYIEGSGDEIPDILKDLGYQVTMLGDEQLTLEHLKQYDAVIAGIRAYNTRERLKFAQTALMAYVAGGGRYIVQYNVAFGLHLEQTGPYPFKIGRGRISDEEAEMRFLIPEHPLLTFPNRIRAADFSAWVQERGIYFAQDWDARYEPLFAVQDPGEEEQLGSTLFCRYGKGTFIYTGLAWFRQLPAGVPGAYRLFVNMISGGGDA